MPSGSPVGEPAPRDGTLPTAALKTAVTTPFSVYVHIPFCAARCGYCDFNTYTSAELGAAPGALQTAYVEALKAELALARNVVSTPPAQSVFFGGGTPTLLAPSVLNEILQSVVDTFGLAADAEITTEANPESVDAKALNELRAAGFNRISFGMQSADPAILSVLERRHTPERIPRVIDWARQAGFDNLSLDLIYGTPGESLESWRRTLQTAISLTPEHLSAYALTVEPGTRLYAKVTRGEFPGVIDDDQADCYLVAEEVLTAAGYKNYEISNWSLPEAECRHNLAYWKSDNWWGIGAGAHSHIGTARWWNVQHPRAYVQALLGDGHSNRCASPESPAEASEIMSAEIQQMWNKPQFRPESPAEARELLSVEQQREERVMLELRLASGLAVAALTQKERSRLPDFEGRGLLRQEKGRVYLTLKGRLLADAVILELLE